MQSPYLPRSTPPPLRPKRAAPSACNKRSPHPPEIAESQHRSVHMSAPAPQPIPPLHEILSTRAAGEIAQSPPDSSSPSPRSVHSLAPPHLFPAAAAPSVPTPQSRSSTPLSPSESFSLLPPCSRSGFRPAFYSQSLAHCNVCTQISQRTRCLRRSTSSLLLPTSAIFRPVFAYYYPDHLLCPIPKPPFVSTIPPPTTPWPHPSSPPAMMFLSFFPPPNSSPSPPPPVPTTP